MLNKTLFSLYLTIFSILIVGCLFGSSARPVDKIQEARIVETSREMLVSQDWLVPHYNGELRLQKPPLTYWTTALSYQVFGVSEWSSRVPSMLFALASAGVLMMWLNRTLQFTVAMNAVLVMATSFIGLRYFRSAEADATLLFFVLCSCVSGYQWITTLRNRFAYCFMLGLGLGFLTKGPAAIAIPLLSVLGFALIHRQWAAFKSLLKPWGLVLFFFTAFAWYAWIYITLPDAASLFFSKQVDETFVSGTHRQPLYWYLLHAIDFFAPWSLLLVPAGVWCYQRPIPAPIRFALVWLCVVFVLLTGTVNKQTQYALLLLPPIAIVIAYYLSEACGRFYTLNRVLFYLLALSVPIVFGVGVIKSQAMDLSFAWILGWLLLLLTPWAMVRWGQVDIAQRPVIFAASFALFNYLYAEQYIAKDAEKSDIKELVHYVASQPIPATQLFQYRPENGAISFYAERVIPPLSAKQLHHQINQSSGIWLFSKDKPTLEGVQFVEQKVIGRWTLWKVSAQPK